MSLRARLIAALIVLAAAGLVTLAAVTYAEQRSFLLDRVDQQARDAQRAVSFALAGPDEPGEPPPGLRLPAPPLLRVPGAPGRPDEGGSGPQGLPRGTVGQLRTSLGRVVRSTAVRSYGDTALPTPKLPSRIPLDKPITVGSAGGSGLRYRVIAEPTHDRPALMTVVALPLREADVTLDRLLRVEALVIGAVLLLLGGLAWWVVRLGLKPLDRMGETAGAIARGDLSRRVSPTSERTEVGRLGLALNAMLGQIEKAFAERQASENRLRQFLADASHELRTPLASIRGYAELFRIGAARKPADTEKAMGRIEDESARMGALVENLLTLARLDQMPEVARKPVDLAQLARDAADDARAVAPDRTVSLDADEPVTVLGDSSQLRQVLGNLVRNALMHTPAGTPIDLSVRRGDGGDGVLEVRDHGRGLPSDDTDALFERFWRSDPGRERGRGGAGLGLSIVAAIVDGHHGRVSAANAPGGGASFTISLPAAEPESAPAAPAPPKASATSA
ncbi:MAG: two-component system, OmpR family, sensor kinase [Thermoleophilaceae bacterium]|jgi:two-component system OmpR family sensor kinase|nr:two-component system, OmpR family, sensor kinase [Thermoleophilaceae bacterium]